MVPKRLFVYLNKTVYNKIAKMISDRKAIIAIGIADHFSNGGRDLNFDDRAKVLTSLN